jgi:PIN domain nuclease of toxin-antitoxin system
MKGLLDTHAFIWLDSDPGKLSANAAAFLEEPSNTILLSVASIWEILIKQQLKKLTLSLPLQIVLSQQQANGIQILAILPEHVLALESLPAVHKDPFDRLLAAQANVESAVIVSADPIFSQYPVSVIW